MRTQIIAGFLPLMDSALLVAAKRFGFAEDENIDLTLVRETSWANIRDRMAIGHFDAAHMLAPMPIAANLGLTQIPMQLMAPMALGLGGNAVTVSCHLLAELEDFECSMDLDPRRAGKAIKAAVLKRKQMGRPVLRFGVVHPFSGHNMELRYWLSACGVDPERDVKIIIMPPPLLPDALASETLDGFCVGEPWNSVAANLGYGTILTTKSAIWRSSPEKVLAVRANCSKENAAIHERLIRALFKAAEWCDKLENREDLAQALSAADFLNIDAALIRHGLSGKVTASAMTENNDFFIPFERAATFPWQSHALWFYSQMVRWGMVTHCKTNMEKARHSYRPDLYRKALAPLGVSLPAANSKVEGALPQPTAVGATAEAVILGPDGFFDDRVFDPDRLDEYLAQSSSV